MEFFQSAFRFWQFYRRAQTRFDIHSPFASQLIDSYFNKNYLLPPIVERVRRELELNKTSLTPEDYGAGPKTRRGEYTVSAIAKKSLSTSRQLNSLFHLCRLGAPDTVLELGTSFGLSALVLQLGAPNALIYSLEGNRSIAAVAQKNVEAVTLPNKPKLITGSFAETLPGLLQQISKLDFVFIDGEHTFSGTMRNMKMIEPLLHTGSLVLIHDIYWSDEMMQAWSQCKSMQRVQMSIDFFDVGILIYKEELGVKQHFRILPYWSKPWHVGLFAPKGY